MSVTGKEKKTCTAILLAGGQGKRMGTDTQKQYLLIRGYPVLYYSLRTFQQSEIIDDVILVTGSGQTDYVRREFVERYGFSKVSRIVEGGRERYDSVWEGLKAAQDAGIADDSYIFIHDSARLRWQLLDTVGAINLFEADNRFLILQCVELIRINWGLKIVVALSMLLLWQIAVLGAEF